MLLRMSGAFVSSDDTWVLWAVLVAFAALSIYCEQHFKWGEKLSGPVIGLILAVAATNLNILPSVSPVYDTVWTYCIPLSVALLLFRADLKKIIKDTGKAFLAFNISSVGTIIGAVVAFLALRHVIPELSKMTAVITGSYIGGGVNLFSIAETVKPAADQLSAQVVADNFVMAMAFFALLWIPSSAFFKRHYKHPFEDKLATQATGDAKTRSANYWGKKEISLLDLATTVAVAFIVVTIASKVSGYLGSITSGLLNIIVGNQFVILTIFSVTLATIFPKFFAKLRGAQEIGTFLIYIFFVVIGCPADIGLLIKQAPLLFVFCFIVAAINIVWTLGIGKVCKISIEELTVASNANLGGPSTAAAMAVGKGYNDLVIPAILIGLWGYLIGTPLGLLLYNLVNKIP